VLIQGLLLEFDVSQHVLEAFARHEDHTRIGDVAGAQLFGLVCPFARNGQAEGAEVAQFHDVALGEFIGNNSEQGLDGSDQINGLLPRFTTGKEFNRSLRDIEFSKN